MINVEVVIAYRDRAETKKLQLADGATVTEALEAAGWQARLDAGEAAAVGIFGQPANADVPLRDGDRVELYRPLLRDPREARRELAARGLDISKRG